DDGFALFAQLAQNAEQVIGLGRGQNAGRLVEDEGVGATIERLQNLDALLLTNRKVFNDRVRIDLEPIVAGELLEMLPRLVERRAEQGRVFSAQHDVFENREIVDQHEV